MALPLILFTSRSAGISTTVAPMVQRPTHFIQNTRLFLQRVENSFSLLAY